METCGVLSTDGPGHATIHYWKKQLSSKVFDNAFKFAFVRNPYTRFLSLYANPMGPDDFETFVNKLVPQKTVTPKERYTIPQASFICDDNDNILVDFVGRFENLEKDWRKICVIIGIDNELPHIRTSSEALDPNKNYWTSEAKKKIEEYYKRDFKIFGYKVNESKEVSPPANPLSTKKEVRFELS